MLKKGRIRIGWLAACLFWFSRPSVLAQSRTPEIIGFLPAAGPEGTRVEIIGKNLQDVSATLFGKNPAVFSPVSQLIVSRSLDIHHHCDYSAKTGQQPNSIRRLQRSAHCGRSELQGWIGEPGAPACGLRIGAAVGIALADTRVRGHESAQVEVAWTRLSCRIHGTDVVLNDDGGQVRGGLYSRQPWFGTDAHDPMPLAFDLTDQAAVLRVGVRTDRIWHFWSSSARVALPPGKLEGCTVRGPSQDFCWCSVADGYGLLALSDDSVRRRRE